VQNLQQATATEADCVYVYQTAKWHNEGRD